MGKKNILFIGLGNMGLPMSSHLIKAGHIVYGIDLNIETLSKFEKIGGIIVADLDKTAAKSDITLTSLPSPAVVQKVFLGNDGLLNKLPKNSYIIDFSTISPSVNQEVHDAARNLDLHYLGAPVSGSTEGAINATLTIMVGGDTTVYEEMYPILKLMGSNTIHLGTHPGMGTKFKLLNNLLLGIYNQAVGEGTALAKALGIDQELLYDTLKISFGQSRSYDRNYTGYISKDNYTPGFSVDLLLKDMYLAKEMADDLKIDLPTTNKTIEIYKEISTDGLGNKDMAYSYINMLNKNKIQ